MHNGCSIQTTRAVQIPHVSVCLINKLMFAFNNSKHHYLNSLRLHQVKPTVTVFLNMTFKCVLQK